MANLTEKYIHSADAFERYAMEQRMEIHGFKNIARLELFLWDLEMFLQIQEILQEKIVLKGGAATQFYLPIEAQRTSVDIDLIFDGEKEEIQMTLDSISMKFENEEGLFRFREHKPKVPKTTLALYTFFADVPSVLTETERRTEGSKCELKIEFIIDKSAHNISKATGNNLFAVESDKKYNILSIDDLFADKLTTLGPMTIGIQNERMDEQIKQLYDIWMLAKYNLNAFNPIIIKEKYLARAALECQSRGISFDLEFIKADVRKQLLRVSEMDCAGDAELRRYVNDFKSLYLKSEIEFSPAIVAVAAHQIMMIYQAILENEDCSILPQATKLEKSLELERFLGEEKGLIVRELRAAMIENFSSFSSVEPKILKGKNLVRVFWSIVSRDNINQIEELVAQFQNRDG